MDFVDLVIGMFAADADTQRCRQKLPIGQPATQRGDEHPDAFLTRRLFHQPHDRFQIRAKLNPLRRRLCPQRRQAS
ncbi:MAG: hypothetical protein ACKV0T_28050, partial [Planctomycetales bacterium]